MNADLALRLVPPVAALLIRALHATLRVRHVNPAPLAELNRTAPSYVYAFWHAHLLVMIYARFRHPLTVMISRHKDGELIARTMARFGVHSARGSTSRGGSEALREMLRAARAGHVVIFTPDGPRGPRRLAQPGVVRAAQLAGIPIVPAAVVAERKKVFPSWDRFEVPLPFSRTIFFYGDPIPVPRELTPEQFEQIRLELERRMNELVDRGEREFDALWRAGEP